MTDTSNNSQPPWTTRDARPGSIYEVCQFLNISSSKLRQMARDGYGPKAIRFDGITRYRGQDVEAWLAERVQQ